MRNLILTFIILAYSVSLTAQDYVVVLNADSRNVTKIEEDSELKKYTSDILLNKGFNYRAFLKKTKNSKVNFHLNGSILTEHQLTKLLKENVRKAANYTEFQQFLQTSSQFNRVLKEREMQLLYERFKGGTINSYMQDLAENW